MTKVIKYGEEMFGWRRKPGPLKVWRLVDGRKKDDDGNVPRFSIQEIPKDRMDDVMELMCTVFARDEPISNHTKVINDPVAMEDFRKLWSFALGQGIVVGAFLVDENNPKPILAGVNMTLVNCETTEKNFKANIVFDAEMSKKIIGTMEALGKEKNTLEVYNVDKYITAFGLCIDPKYRGQGLGAQLLEARKEMSEAYDIHATSTIFTALAAQKIAAKVGFELLAERNFDDMKNDDGTEMFPGIPHKSIKLMGKHFS